VSGESLQIERPALEQLASLLLERAGLKITPDGYYGLRLALTARMPAIGLDDAGEYVRRLRGLAGETELRALLPLVTVGKTEFFRDTRQFNAFERTVFPELVERASLAGRTAKIWSAGCATGEEPYSISMVALERVPSVPVDIWATDLNPAAAESAAKGLFPARRLVGLSEERIARFFTSSDGVYQVTPAVRQLVSFEAHNLAAPIWPQVSAGSLDAIFCRNVIIYFDQSTIVGVMDRFFEALRPGGWMFLGYSESLFKTPTRFEMVEVGGTFAYRRPATKSPTEIMRRSLLTPLPRPLPRLEVHAPRPPLAIPPNGPSVPMPPRPSVPLPVPRASVPRGPGEPGLTPVERLREVVSAIDQGDFPRALRQARRLVDDVPDDLAARLTLGNVYVLMGSLDEARESFGAALAREPLCVEARVYLGLAGMQAGQLEDAKVELTRALFLEPTLALGHYLLGQVNERRKDLEGARRAYRNAIKHRRAPEHELLGHFPDLPRSNEAVGQSAQYRLAAISET
jgi:chemotaxis protein methyltransferase CheR